MFVVVAAAAPARCLAHTTCLLPAVLVQEQLPPAPPVATEAEAAAAAAAAAAQAATPGARTAPRAPASSGASGQQGGSPLSEAQLQLGDALIAVGGENNAYHRLDLIRRLVPLVTPVGHGMLRQPNAVSAPVPCTNPHALVTGPACVQWLQEEDLLTRVPSPSAVV